MTSFVEIDNEIINLDKLNRIHIGEDEGKFSILLSFGDEALLLDRQYEKIEVAKFVALGICRGRYYSDEEIEENIKNRMILIEDTGVKVPNTGY